MQPLTAEQRNWVDKTLGSLSLSERVAQLMLTKIDHDGSVDDLLRVMERVPFGGLFVWCATAEEHRRRIGRLQEAARVPIVVAADLENGGGHVIAGGTPFPDTLALAAADSEELARTMGRCAAIEGRSVGIHWTFAPVVDVNINPDNPIANSRSLGDDPDRVARLARAVLRGMQENGLAACAKHFPGDGVDDVDQHVVTAVNHLAADDWKRISGRPFAAAFEAGVMSVMAGHIALPFFDPHRDARGAYRPATVSRPLITDLLKDRMGFDGVVVTDDMNMGGVAGYMDRRRRTVECIKAGCDMILFPALPEAHDLLLDAVASGELPEDRVNDAARRVLELKARLDLHRGHLVRPAATGDQAAAFRAAARDVAEKAVCRVRDVNGILPLRGLTPGARVLTVTMANCTLDLPEIDRELAARGFDVRHISDPGYGAVDTQLAECDAIFVNLTFRANWGMGSPRSIGHQNRLFMGGFFMEHPRVVFTSFGSPYHLRQFGTWPTYVNVHSFCADSQRAAVRAWLGEIPMTAGSPVGNLERTF